VTDPYGCILSFLDWHKYSKDNSKDVKHILETQHEHRQTVDILKIISKGRNNFIFTNLKRKELTLNEQHETTHFSDSCKIKHKLQLRGIQEVLRNHKLVVYDPHSKMF
jgi:hypothetical protein